MTASQIDQFIDGGVNFTTSNDELCLNVNWITDLMTHQIEKKNIETMIVHHVFYVWKSYYIQRGGWRIYNYVTFYLFDLQYTDVHDTLDDLFNSRENGKIELNCLLSK